MLYRVVLPLLPLLLLACNFDTSTSAPLDDLIVNLDSDGGATCDGFVGQPCGECGREVCVAGPGGAQILCQPDLSAPSCQAGKSCSAEGLCISLITCSDGDSRRCGECGAEYCLGGAWTGDCLVDDSSCYYGTACLAAAGELPTCVAGCSTEGHQTPYGDGPGLNDGADGGPGVDAIPDIVSIGYDWYSMDGCQQQGGDYRECECTYNYGSSYPEVECDSFCRD